MTISPWSDYGLGDSMLRSYYDQDVEPEHDLQAATPPSGQVTCEVRYVRTGFYHTNGQRIPCIVKQLYRELTADAVALRLRRVRPLLLGLRWTRDAVDSLAQAEPIATLPFDYCRADDGDNFDAAVLARVGEFSLEQVRRTPKLIPPSIAAALDSPIVRLRIVRVLAVALAGAQVVAKVPHYDVADRNVRISVPKPGAPLRAYLIDWDEGLEAGPEVKPLDEEVYPWTPELADVYRAHPWQWDWFPLMRYILWAMDDRWRQFRRITNRSDAEKCRGLNPSLVHTANGLASKCKTSVLADLLRRIADAVEMWRCGALVPYAFPSPVEYVVAVRAEHRALSGDPDHG
jgi:hypothetical protein